jgi:hypothetical protein
MLLGGIGLLAVTAYVLLSLRIETPWIMVDELIYSELAKGVAEDGELLLRGEPTTHVSFLYPVLIAPAWLVSSMETTYVLVKTINVILITLAAVPVYLWARRLMPSAWTFVVTALVLLIPGLLYSGMVMTENAFFPAFVLASFAIALALERPTVLRQALMLGAIGLAASVRVQGVVLIPILLTALLADGLLEWRGTQGGRLFSILIAKTRAFRHSLIVLGVVAVGYAIVKVVQGESLSSGLGAYQVVSDANYSLVDTARWSLYHAAELCLAVGVIPVSAFLVLFGLAAWRGPSSAAERAFLAVTASASIWIVATVASFASRFILRIEERNMFHLMPLFLLALGLWLSRGAPRPLRVAIPAALVPVALVLYLPLERFLNGASLFDTFGLIPASRVAAELDGGVDEVETLVTVGVLLAGLAFVFLPRKLALVLMPAAVATFFAMASYSVSGAIRDYSKNLQGFTYVENGDWIDDVIGSDGDAVYFFGGGADRAEEASRLWQTEFWNRSLGSVYRAGAPDHTGFPSVDVAVDDETGAIAAANGRGLRSGYVVTAFPGFELAGDLIAQHSGLALYRTDGSVGVATARSGLYGDGWSGPSATYTQFSTPGNRAGRVRVGVSRKAWMGPDVPGRVHIRVGRPGGAGLDGVTAERRWVIHSGRERSFMLPTPRPPFQVEVTVDPTFSPATFGFGDPRQLGAQVSFDFTPGSG